MLNGRKYQRVLLHVRQRTGLPSNTEAERAIAATVEALGLALRDPYRVADWIPAPLCGFLLRGAHEESRGLLAVADRDSLFRTVKHLEQVPLAKAVELAEVVCEALADALDPDALAVLVRRLPPSIAELLRGAKRSPSVPGRHPVSGSDLASGRPGSRHPLSEARSPLAHLHSVVVTSNPHSGTKISSGHQTTDDADSTLAGGRPGSVHPLAERGR